MTSGEGAYIMDSLRDQYVVDEINTKSKAAIPPNPIAHGFQAQKLGEMEALCRATL